MSVGSILGHHPVSKKLYAIHRNQKTYLIFHDARKKWLPLTNQQFKENAANVGKKNLIILEGTENSNWLLNLTNNCVGE